jgi:hypothetical protein
MFFLERIMKMLKDFVRQNARVEGSMAEGWLIQEGIVFISQYLHQIDSLQQHTLSILKSSEERLNDNVQSDKGRTTLMSNDLHARINIFCLLNSDSMKGWVEKYEKIKLKKNNDRSQFRRQNGHGAPFPSHPKKLPDNITTDWLHDEMQRIKIEQGINFSRDEWEYARRSIQWVCNRTIYIFVYLYNIVKF